MDRRHDVRFGIFIVCWGFSDYHVCNSYIYGDLCVLLRVEIVNAPKICSSVL